MNVPRRVHVVPLGYEHDRVIEPPRRLNADKVVLLSHEEDDEEPEYHDEAREYLQANNIELEERESNIFELYSCLGVIAEVITEHEGDDVYVNLATGSKVTAIAGMIACMATGASPYYVSAEQYGLNEGEEPPEKPVSFGVSSIEELSGYPIEAPSEQDIHILSHLDSEGPASKKEIIEYGEEHALPFIADAETESLQGKYRRLETNVMEGLEENEYVELNERGRKKYVHITEDGENTLRAFRYLIE